MDVAKIELEESRNRFLRIAENINEYLDTLSTKIKDSKGVGRDVFYVDENVVAAVGKGDEKSEVIVEQNNFDVDLLLLKGEVKIVINDTIEHLLNSKKKHLFIPKNTAFVMLGMGKVNRIIQRTEK